MQKKWLLFCALLVIALQVLVSFPLTMWAENQFNFTMGLTDAVVMAALVLVLVAAISLPLCWLIPERASAYLTPFIAVVSVLIYFQQNILIWDYGILDGRQIDFAANKHLGYIDMALWLAGLAAFVLVRKAIAKKVGLILSFTAGVTLIATAAACLAFEANYATTNAALTEDKKFAFSKKKNILLFVFDGFQSDLFWEIIDKHPELRRDFDGFTFYPDTAAVFAKTYPSIPLLLTGKAYKKTQPITEFINSAYAGSLLEQMIDAGWNVGLYPVVPSTVVNSEKYASNVARASQWSNKVSAYLQALDLSLFRLVPHAAKQRIYNHGDFIAQRYLSSPLEYVRSITASEETARLPTPHRHEGLNFLANLQQTASTELSAPAFRFYHLKMPHQPFTLNSELEYGFIGDDFAAYREYAYATVKLVVAYLAELRKRGVYDRSTILIATDHGGGEYDQQKYSTDSKSYSKDKFDGNAKASGRALLLVKPADENGALKLSRKPVSLLDVAPSVAAYAGLDTKQFQGVPLAEISDGEKREREYSYYRFTGWDSKYLDDFEVFNITGNIYDDDAWRRVGILQASPEASEKKPYQLGDIVRYGADIKANADHSNAFIVGDDYDTKGSAVQFKTRRFRLAIDLAQPLKRSTLYTLQLGLGTHTHVMRAEIRVGNELLDSVLLPRGSPRKHTLFFDPRILDNKNEVPVEVRIVEASDPEGKVALVSIKLFEARVATLNDATVIRFAGNIDRYYPFGFWPPEPWGRWTARGESYLYFRAGKDFCARGHMLLRMQQFYKYVKPGDFSIAINDVELTPAHYSHNDNDVLYYFDCSRKDFLCSGANKLVFQPGKLTKEVPAQGIDERKAQGAGFVSLKFVKHGAAAN